MGDRKTGETRIFISESITEFDVTLDFNVNYGQTESSDRYFAANNLVKVLCFRNPECQLKISSQGFEMPSLYNKMLK